MLMILVNFQMAMAQDSLLRGKWQLVEMQKDSVIVFNRGDIEFSMKARFQNALKTNDSLNLADSLAIKEYVEFIYPQMQQIFLEFADNGTLTAGVLDLLDGAYFFIEKSGSYWTDYDQLGMRISGSQDSYVYEVMRDTLLLTPIIAGQVYQRGYSIYARKQ